MKKRLRLLAWLITLTLLCQLLPFSAFAQSDIAQTLVQRRVSASSLDEQNDLSSVTFEGGTGTSEDPYQIATAEQLDAIRNNLGASYVLVNDIDLSNYGNWVPIGWSFDPNPSPGSTFFYGTLDGQNHSISNLTINYDAFVADSSNPCLNRLGLFYEIHANLGNFGDGWVRIGGIVKNLNLDNINFSTTTEPLPRSGGIAGYTLGEVLISNCNVSGSISDSATTGNSSTLGGLCGYASSSSNDYFELSDCTSSVSITVSRTSPQAGEAGDVTCGGIVGSSSYFSNISNCINYGSITVSGLPFFRCVVGGIVGKFLEGSIDKCVNYGTLSVEDSVYYFHYYLTGGCYIGGICGYSDGQCYSNPPADYRFTITNCVNSGNINGSVTSSDSEATSGGVAGICAAPDNAWTGNSTQTYIDNCFNTASKVNFIFNRADVFSYPSYCISTNSEIVRSVYFLDTTRLNGRIPDKSDSLRNGESLSYYEILSRIKEIFPDFELEPAPDIPDLPEEEFSFHKDNLSFLNAPQYFFLGDELNYWKYAYNNPKQKRENYPKSLQTLPEDSGRLHLSDDKMEKVTRNLSESAHRWIANRIKYTWTGSCYGMVAISLIHYLEPDRLPYSRLSVSGVDDNSLTYQLPSPIESQEIEDFVNYYMMQQFLPTYYKTCSNYLYNCEHNFEGTLNEILNSLYKHHPVFVSMSNHQILFLEVLETYSDHYVIGIYDPNEAEEQRLTLYKDAYAVDDDPKIHISYGENNYIRNYILSDDLDLIDVRNYFDITPDYETQTDYTDGHIIIDADNDFGFIFGHQYYYRTENGKLCEKNSNVKILKSSNALNEDSSNNLIELVFPKPSSSEDAVLELTSSGVNDASMLLNDTMLSVSTDGPTRLTYNEQARTIDVTSSTPTGVSLLLTQNNPSEAWPWDTFAVDVPQSTTLHIELTGDSLKISGDYLSGATYATENMTDDVVSGGDIPDGMDNVTIVNKNGSNGNTTDIKTPDPVEPAELTVSVSGGTIIQINDDAFAESLTTHTAKQGDKITIMANTTDKFNGWTVNEGDVELDDATAPTTTFTMGEKSVEITAEYKDDSTEPVEPAELTVSVSGGTIIQINDDAFAESLTTHIAKQGDKITIMADTTDKFNGWIVNEGDVTLDDATAPTTTFTMNEKSVRITAEYQNSSTDPTPTPTPGGNSSSGSGGGGGGGAAVLIGVGAAAAITAGVFMMSPVEIKGRVVLADQAAVPGAKISLLREGKVVAQTTADENGNFSLKAKRGSYELTAAYTNADGQLIYKTIDIKAPAKDLTVTF